MLRIYISGPMTGKPDLNFPAFHAAAAFIRREGVEVVNPAELNLDPGLTWEQCLRTDLMHLLSCQAIAMLPGWQLSRGARLEHHVAEQLGLNVITLPASLFEPA